jgi:hypothetical protein
MTAGELDLLFDEIKIVEQPFRRGCDLPGLIHRQCRAVESAQDFLITIQLREESVPARPRDDPVLLRQCLGVPRQLLNAEQFCAQRQLARDRASLRRQSKTLRSSPHAYDYSLKRGNSKPYSARKSSGRGLPLSY